MALKISVPERNQLSPRIAVMGIGGAGGNAVNNMMAADLQGVEFIAANTDAQALSQSSATRKIQLGIEATKGLGAGTHPEVGRAAAEEALEELTDALTNTHMLFITVGMGGGTGTGAAPLVAKLARDMDILTVGVVTKPFQFEGTRRMATAEAGIREIQQYVHTLIVIPNQNLFRVANESTRCADAFAMADGVLLSGVRGITDLIVVPGRINLDFADIRAVMSEMGNALMGTGEGEGEGREVAAAESAVSNPLLDDISLRGARDILINVSGGDDLTLFEMDKVVTRITEEVGKDARIVWGTVEDPDLNGKIRVTVVATGIGIEHVDLPETPARVEDAVLWQPMTPVRGQDADVAAEEPEPESVPAATTPGQIAAFTVPVEARRPAPAPGDMRPAASDGASAAAVAEASPPAAEDPGHPLADIDGAETAPDLFEGAAPAADNPPRRLSLLRPFGGGRRENGAEGGYRPADSGDDEPEAAPARQPGTGHLDGIDPDERILAPSDRSDVEPLEIPAFLRRQAN